MPLRFAALAFGLLVALGPGSPAAAQSAPGAAPSPFASAAPVAPAVRAAIVLPAIDGDAWTPARIAALQHDLDALLASAPSIHSAHVGVLAIDTKSGMPLYQWNADDAFAPASTLKLVVGSAALEKLGPAFRFATRGYVASGEVSTVLLLGGGDPFLETADLEGFADSVARLGVRQIRLTLSAHRYDDEPYAAGWTWDDFAYDYAAPISALTLDENVVNFLVRPGPRPGSAPQVEVTNLPPGLHRALTCVEVVISPKPNATLLPGQTYRCPTTLEAGAESTLDVTLRDHQLTVIGGIALDARPESLAAAAPNANERAYEVASEVLRGKGVEIDAANARADPFASGYVLPGSARLIWTHNSPPLSEFLGSRFWIPSDNLVAELLLKELGYQTSGAPGTTESGIAFEKAWLQSIGVDPATTTLADGSGLSQYDRITPRDLAAVLQHDWNGPYRDLVLNSLPVGGARGTIEGIAGTPAAGRVFAKTGSMMHVRGLAGYLATERHGAVTFVFTVDDWLGDYPALAALRAAILSRIVQD